MLDVLIYATLLKNFLFDFHFFSFSNTWKLVKLKFLQVKYITYTYIFIRSE